MMAFRSGFVSVVGRPNVGKSTLLNRLVGQKIAITSQVAQTTRHRIRGVITLPNEGQLVLMDTPGFSKPLDSLGELLVDESQAAIADADAYVIVVNGNELPGKGDAYVVTQVLEKAAHKDAFILLAINKADQLKQHPGLLGTRCLAYEALLKGYKKSKTLLISARTGKECHEIVPLLLKHLPVGPAYYDEDALTDQRLREMSAEIIREKVMRLTQEELPHSVAIVIDDYNEADPAMTRITATLYVNQASQKGMIIGKGATLIKQIGTEARKDIETLLGHRAHLDLNVAVKANWRRDAEFLKSMGLAVEPA
ncbi:MAG: GTPase Era [Vampirovibrionales bacterium]|nr:GTPase Era [Vampirovibrionales bacterium]